MARSIDRSLFDRNVLADVIPPWADISRYRLFVVPALFLVSDETARVVQKFVENGGHVLVTYLSGVVELLTGKETSGGLLLAAGESAVVSER